MFAQSRTVERVGQCVGYAFSYALFTTVLFTALSLFNRIPSHWGYPHIAAITAGVTLLGLGIRRLLG